MKASRGDTCCVCEGPAVEKSFDGTGWCQIHLSDWNAFLRWERVNYNSLDETFSAWLEQVKSC